MTPPSINAWSRLPSVGLRTIVRRYFARRMRFDRELVLTFPIRPDLFLDFHLYDCLRLRDRDGVPRPIEAKIQR